MMAGKASFLLLACFCFTGAAANAAIENPLRAQWGKKSPPPPTINTLVLHDKEGAMIEVIGKYKIYDPHTGELISTRFLGKAKYLHALGDGLKWGEEFPGHHQLLLVPIEPQARIFVDGVEYTGMVAIYDIGGSISVVNDTPVEDYLASVMANKYTTDLPEETLSAFAIAERTNAYFQAQYPKSVFWAVDGSLTGYKGYVANPAPAIQKAIRNTRYMVLSKTSPYEGVITPFIAQWHLGPKGVGSNNNPSSPIPASITTEEAEQMAKNGDHAATILEKAFPKATIQIVSFSGH